MTPHLFSRMKMSVVPKARWDADYFGAAELCKLRRLESFCAFMVSMNIFK